MDRIRVVGSAGSGKTTTATAIALRLGIPRLELDAVHWLPDWKERDPDDFRRIVLDFAASNPRWVMDGNYSGRLGDRIDHLVDTFVWLDLPRWRVITALIVRCFRRSITGEELWAGTGNREHLRSLVDRNPHENIVLWSWGQHHRNRERYGARCASDSRWIRLRSRGEVRRFIEGLG